MNIIVNILKEFLVHINGFDTNHFLKNYGESSFLP